jgi:hypothetical protein
MIRQLFPMLRREILEAREAVDRQNISIETIKQKLSLLGDVDNSLIEKSVVQNRKITSEATAAKEIIAAFSTVSFETVDRYTRVFSNGSDIPSYRGGHILVRLLPAELLPKYEKLRGKKLMCTEKTAPAFEDSSRISKRNK